MAIVDYSTLLTAVADYHHRDDGRIADHVHFAEKRINSALFSRLGETEVNLTTTVGSRYITLPADYLEPLALWMTEYGNRTEMVFTTPENLPLYPLTRGLPRYYTVDQGKLAFDYLADAEYSMQFRYKLGYDIATTMTNHVLNQFPQCYLYGALREACVLSEDDAGAQKYEALFQQAIEELQKIERGNRKLATLACDPALTGNTRSNIFTGGF